MNITARAHDFELSEAIAGFARDQIFAALNRFSDGIIFVRRLFQLACAHLAIRLLAS